MFQADFCAGFLGYSSQRLVIVHIFPIFFFLVLVSILAAVKLDTNQHQKHLRRPSMLTTNERSENYAFFSFMVIEHFKH